MPELKDMVESVGDFLIVEKSGFDEIPIFFV